MFLVTGNVECNILSVNGSESTAKNSKCRDQSHVSDVAESQVGTLPNCEQQIPRDIVAQAASAANIVDQFCGRADCSNDKDTFSLQVSSPDRQTARVAFHTEVSPRKVEKGQDASVFTSAD